MEYMETEEPVDEGRLSEETKEVKLTTDTEEMAKDKGSGEKGGSTKELVSTTKPEIVSTVTPPKFGSQRNMFPGALLHNNIAQVMSSKCHLKSILGLSRLHCTSNKPSI
ncbi:hypothetical protein Tco_0486147 [Tanacetum coccineum]